MASALSHAVTAAAFGAPLRPPRLPAGVWGLAMVWSIVPDIDVIGFQLGIPYEAVLGHRGVTHSFAFAAVIATFAVWLHRSRGLLSKEASAGAWAYLFCATASHGVLDAMTSGGLGVALFAPFSNARYFLPWRPIAVSPIGFAAFFSRRGLHILANEIIWIWIPSGLLALALVLKRRSARADDSSQSDGSAPFADRSASWNGIVLSGILMLVISGSLVGVYAWVGPRAIRENRYGTYAETRTPEARWLALVLPPSATVIHERHAIDIDVLYGSFRFDPAERREFETMLAPGFSSNVQIDQDASFPNTLPLRPSAELLRRSGFELYSKKQFGLAIEWNKGVAFFWYSPP